MKEKPEYDDCTNLLNQDVPVKDLTNFMDVQDEDIGISHPNYWKKHWKEMPDFEQEYKGPYKTVYVHFRNQEDYEEFAKLIGQNLTEKTKAIWHPKKEKENVSILRWMEEE